MSGQLIMIAPGQMATGRVMAPVGAPPVASLGAQTSTSDWFERAGQLGQPGQYADAAVANAERAHRHTIEGGLDKPSRSWTTGEVVRTYLGNADGERRFSSESPRWRDLDAAAQHLVEHERRFRNAPAQGQRGAIDDNLTIAHEQRSDPPQQSAGPA
jgi:hypothetical protein